MNEHASQLDGDQQGIEEKLPDGPEEAVGAVAAGPRNSGETATDATALGLGTLSVTRPQQISPEISHPLVSECRSLLAGIDTLDFGMYVEFGTSWQKIVAKLRQLKAKARGTPGIVIGDRCLVLPGGKPNYQFHLQYPGFQLYLSRKSSPDGETPNVFVALNSETLWHCGERESIELVQRELRDVAPGTVQQCRMSRCDLAADLLIPGGISDRFIREHLVSYANEGRILTKNDAMQTQYIGGTSSDISLRIYNKSTEIRCNDKLWFLTLWDVPETAEVWRFEFQIRRPALKAFQNNSLDDLLQKRAGLWQYLTTDRLSLRLNDNENSTR